LFTFFLFLNHDYYSSTTNPPTEYKIDEEPNNNNESEIKANTVCVQIGDDDVFSRCLGVEQALSRESRVKSLPLFAFEFEVWPTQCEWEINDLLGRAS
jgi:hypothetical protein